MAFRVLVSKRLVVSGKNCATLLRKLTLCSTRSKAKLLSRARLSTAVQLPDLQAQSAATQSFHSVSIPKTELVSAQIHFAISRPIHRLFRYLLPRGV